VCHPPPTSLQTSGLGDCTNLPQTYSKPSAEGSSAAPATRTLHLSTRPWSATRCACIRIPDRQTPDRRSGVLPSYLSATVPRMYAKVLLYVWAAHTSRGTYDLCVASTATRTRDINMKEASHFGRQAGNKQAADMLPARGAAAVQCGAGKKMRQLCLFAPLSPCIPSPLQPHVSQLPPHHELEHRWPRAPAQQSVQVIGDGPGLQAKADSVPTADAPGCVFGASDARGITDPALNASSYSCS
jgi:hypothetical protein